MAASYTQSSNTITKKKNFNFKVKFVVNSYVRGKTQKKEENLMKILCSIEIKKNFVIVCYS